MVVLAMQESESFSFLFAFDQRGYTQLEAGSMGP